MSETDKLARAIRVGFGLLFLFLVIQWVFALGKDATDPPHGRSGMRLHTDHETGCQYLSIRPRRIQRIHHAGEKERFVYFLPQLKQ